MSRTYRYTSAITVDQWLKKHGIAYTRWRDLPAMCPALTREHYRDPHMLWGQSKGRAVEIAEKNAAALHLAVREYQRAGILRSPTYTPERHADMLIAEAGERMIAAYFKHRLQLDAKLTPVRRATA